MTQIASEKGRKSQQVLSTLANFVEVSDNIRKFVNLMRELTHLGFFTRPLPENGKRLGGLGVCERVMLAPNTQENMCILVMTAQDKRVAKGSARKAPASQTRYH